VGEKKRVTSATAESLGRGGTADLSGKAQTPTEAGEKSGKSRIQELQESPRWGGRVAQKKKLKGFLY